MTHLHNHSSHSTDSGLKMLRSMLKRYVKDAKRRGCNLVQSCEIQIYPAEVMNMHQERPLHLAARTHSYETVKCLDYLASLSENEREFQRISVVVVGPPQATHRSLMYMHINICTHVLLSIFAQLFLLARRAGCSRSW